MEITKIFSNVEDPSENLYSVLMSEEELDLYQSLFSDSKDENSDLKNKYGKYIAGGTLIGAGVGAAGTALGTSMAIKNKDKLIKMAGADGGKVASQISNIAKNRSKVIGVSMGKGARNGLLIGGAIAAGKYLWDKHKEKQQQQE